MQMTKDYQGHVHVPYRNSQLTKVAQALKCPSAIRSSRLCLSSPCAVTLLRLGASSLSSSVG